MSKLYEKGWPQGGVFGQWELYLTVAVCLKMVLCGNSGMQIIYEFTHSFNWFLVTYDFAL